MKKSYDTKSNPELIGGLTLEDERKAELTLLALLEDMPQPERIPFLLENGITPEEAIRIYEKWYRVLLRYREEKKLNEEVTFANLLENLHDNS